jgi:hypothetical protein
MIGLKIKANPDGTITTIDNRVFSVVVEAAILGIKKSAEEEILARYPEFKQRNLGMGVLDRTEETEMRLGIEGIVAYSHELEAQVNAVTWDGTEETRAAACDVVQSIYWNYVHPESFPAIYTAYQFMLRFTAEERAAFRTAALTDANVADFQQLAQSAQEIRTDDPTTIAGMDYLVSQGLLTQARRDEIMAVD